MFCDGREEGLIVRSALVKSEFAEHPFVCAHHLAHGPPKLSGQRLQLRFPGRRFQVLNHAQGDTVILEKRLGRAGFRASGIVEEGDFLHAEQPVPESPIVAFSSA